MKPLIVATLMAMFAGSLAVAQDDLRVAIPTIGGGPASFDPNMPSYRFAQHVQREPGELVKLDKGVVALMGSGYPKAVFALWDDFQAYASCAAATCDVAYFDYAAGEIRTYALPLAAAADWAYLTDLAHQASVASKSTPPLGIGVRAVVDRQTPSSGFSTYLRHGPPKVREIEPGVIAVEVPQFGYPNSIYASGPGFEAHGICTERKSIYCTMDVFDHRAHQVQAYLIDLDDAVKLETYVNLLEPPDVDR